MSITTSLIINLISTTPTPLRHRTATILRHFFLSPPPHILLSPPKCSFLFHTLPLGAPNPFPEWSRFLDRVSPPAYPNESNIDVFVGPTQLGQEFLSNAHTCLSFARHHPNLLWSLPTEDLKMVVENVSPTLFKDASNVATRMHSFLAGTISLAQESDKPTTVDLMKYLLSYVHVAVVSSEDATVLSRVESSARRLFRELVKTSRSSTDSVVSVQKRSPESFGQATRSFTKNIEMKRGDWICQKCSFMNFAKNPKCLQCEKTRPKHFITGGEWECPQCDFLNFSRNAVCLRCDCKKPEINPLQSSTTFSGLGAHVSSAQHGAEGRLTGSDRQHQQWLTKIIQLESTDLNGASAEEHFSEVINTSNTNFIAHTRNLGIGENPDCVDLKPPAAENNRNAAITQSLNDFLAEKTSASFMTSNSNDFGKHSGDESVFTASDSALAQTEHLSDARSSRDSFSLAEEKLSDEKQVCQTGDDEREVEKSESLFKKVADVHDVKDLLNVTSDEDFLETMPMRKGENRFVVSKKKDRSLTSPMYKRRMAMEQVGNSNYVPFVPFPSGYFAKDKPPYGSDSTGTTLVSVAPANDRTSVLNNIGNVLSANQQTDTMSSTGGTVKQNDDRAAKSSEASNNITQTPNHSSPDGYSRSESMSGASSQSRDNPGVIDPWRQKSLEGSEVNEPDPLDMSEEAKTERWFRRVAQIKDISELSQIPDEDFPSIMPLRKRVNRFVVSKRKTPLERRLTSSRYRRNNPSALNSESDPAMKETESS